MKYVLYRGEGNNEGEYTNLKDALRDAKVIPHKKNEEIFIYNSTTGAQPYSSKRVRKVKVKGYYAKYPKGIHKGASHYAVFPHYRKMKVRR